MTNYTAKPSGTNTWLLSNGKSPYSIIVKFIYSDFYNGLGMTLPPATLQWCRENLKVPA